MPKCYDSECQNQVDEELELCLPCKQKRFPKHPATLREKPRQFGLQGSTPTLSNTVTKGEPPKKDLIEMTFEEVKAKEKSASEWLLANKGLQNTDPKKWDEAMNRYKRIVYILNIKTPM